MNPWERKHDAMLHEFAEVIGADVVSLKIRTLGRDAAGEAVQAYLPIHCWSPPHPDAEPGEETWLNTDGPRSIKWISHDTGVELLVAAGNLGAGCETALGAVGNLRRELAKAENDTERRLVTDVAIEMRWRHDSEVEHRELIRFALADGRPSVGDVVTAASEYLA